MTSAQLTKQRTEALAKGNEIRLGRVALRREIAALNKADGLRRVAQEIRQPTHISKGEKLSRLIVAVERVGTRSLRRYLHVGHTRVSRDIRIEQLTGRQIDEICTHLEQLAAKANT